MLWWTLRKLKMCEQKMVEGGVLPEAVHYAAGWHFGNATRAKE